MKKDTTNLMTAQKIIFFVCCMSCVIFICHPLLGSQNDNKELRDLQGDPRVGSKKKFKTKQGNKSVALHNAKKQVSNEQPDSYIAKEEGEPLETADKNKTHPADSSQNREYIKNFLEIAREHIPKESFIDFEQTISQSSNAIANNINSASHNSENDLQERKAGIEEDESDGGDLHKPLVSGLSQILRPVVNRAIDRYLDWIGVTQLIDNSIDETNKIEIETIQEGIGLEYVKCGQKVRVSIINSYKGSAPTAEMTVGNNYMDKYFNLGIISMKENEIRTINKIKQKQLNEPEFLIAKVLVNKIFPINIMGKAVTEDDLRQVRLYKGGLKFEPFIACGDIVKINVHILDSNNLTIYKNKLAIEAKVGAGLLPFVIEQQLQFIQNKTLATIISPAFLIHNNNSLGNFRNTHGPVVIHLDVLDILKK